MRALIWIVLLFALAVGFSLAGKFDTGYAVLVYPPYRIELSLTLFVIVFLLLLVVGHLFFRLASATLRLPETVRAHRLQQRVEAAHTALEDATTALFEARYAQAEKLANTALTLDTAPWQAALIAAQAAQAQRAYARRDDYLAQAERLAPQQALAIAVTRATGLLDEQRLEEARAEIQRARLLDPKHPELAQLEAKCRV